MTSSKAARGVSPQQAAAWLQHKLNTDDAEFRRRTGAEEALGRLRSASEALVARIRRDRVDLLLGRRIGGKQLAAARDAAAVEDFVRRFYREYWAVFSASALPEGSLLVERVRSGPTTVAEVRQYVDGIPVTDARWTMLFDRAGYLTSVMGSPFDPAQITVGRRPKLDAEQAVGMALDHESLTGEDAEARAELAIEGRANRLVWTVKLDGKRRPAVRPVLTIDAHSAAVVARDDQREHGVYAIPVTHYLHPFGVKDSTGYVTTSDINVDAEVVPGLGKIAFSLQRIGSGRSRIWNAKPTGAETEPQFARTVSVDVNTFTKLPGTTTSNIFNEQQTYYWAQALKTAVDEWGREPNDYGHYPVDPSRAVNVEIVVNGDASMEDDWSSGSSVMHGYFLSGAPARWFSGVSGTVPAVFLFNSAGNSNSPQFFGPEYSGSYSIIAHEVGHFISWQYGGWQGPSDTRLGRSLNEGHSMVLAALLGKRQFGAALEYDESEYVTTGGDDQWTHFVYGRQPLKYSDMNCVTEGDYRLGWPFVQAMWRLMNNLGVDREPIWGSAEAAIANTADMFMHSLYCFTADSTMTWDKLCLGLLDHVYSRIEDGLEQDPLPGYDSWCAVNQVFAEHGLLSECKS